MLCACYVQAALTVSIVLADCADFADGFARHHQEQRGRIAELEHRVRDLEEAVRLLAQEANHAREVAALERAKLLLELQSPPP